jgi:hypothetical protein
VNCLGDESPGEPYCAFPEDFAVKNRMLGIAIAALPIAAVAQSPIDTNRPGFTSSPNVVAPGRWQLETGIDYTRGSGSSRTWSLPAAEIRIGIDDGLEAFVSGINWTRQEGDKADQEGFKDINTGLKWNLSGGDGAFSTALLGQFSIPVGDNALTSDRWDPTAAFIWAGNRDLALSGTVKLSKFKSGYQLDNGLKWAFSAGNSGTVFVEWEANLPEGGDDTHWMNFGYQLLSGANSQLDINGGLGLNNDSDDYRVGLGFSHQF